VAAFWGLHSHSRAAAAGSKGAKSLAKAGRTAKNKSGQRKAGTKRRLTKAR